MDRYIRTSVDADKVMTLLMDAPGKSVNTCSPQLFQDLAAALETVERDKPAAVIFASAKVKSFNAGADLFEIKKMDGAQVAEFLALGQKLFNRIAELPMP